MNRTEQSDSACWIKAFKQTFTYTRNERMKNSLKAKAKGMPIYTIYTLKKQKHRYTKTHLLFKNTKK